MKKILLIIISFLMLSIASTQNFNAQWGNGYSLASLDGEHSLKFGGRIMYDYATWNTGDNSFSSTEFRRVRLFNSGKVYNSVKYKMEFDFSGEAVSFKDVYMEAYIPYVGNFKVGHFKEPFRLEALTSSKYITFMERALPISFSPERNIGFLLHNTFIDDKLSIQVGLFREAENGNDKNIDNTRNLTGRVTFLPIDNGNNLLHLGLAFSNRSSSDSTYSIYSRAENHLGTKLLDLDISNVDNMYLLGFEMAFVMGPFSIQGEYVMNNLDAVEEYIFSGYYGQCSYFLTGEKRVYKNSLSGFDRVSPNANMKEGEGFGAIEIAVRYSSMDLSEAQAGTLNDITAGLNWYLNPCTRIMFNYVMGVATDYNGIETNENIIQCRMQIDF
jgi:phosphate-selective porin OprO/OprP